MVWAQRSECSIDIDHMKTRDRAVLQCAHVHDAHMRAPIFQLCEYKNKFENIKINVTRAHACEIKENNYYQEYTVYT